MTPFLFLVAALSAVDAVEAERAFAAKAQTSGQWTAFREFATADAIMFVPQAVNAQQWLAGRSDPPRAVMWWPASSYLSCDGTIAVNSGPWLRNGGALSGYFTTLWQRQPDGGWKWLLDHGDGVAKPRRAGDAVRSRRASCQGRPPSMPAPASPDSGLGSSADNSLIWRWEVAADGGRTIRVLLWNGTRHETAVEDNVAGQEK